MARPSKLTPEVQDAIVKAIRGGSYDWVAAESAGVTGTTFRNWMKRGAEAAEAEDPAKEEQLFLAFFAQVRAARAEARRKAEARLFKEDPFKWLRYGPGRERPDEPGWTEASQVDVTSGGQRIEMVPWAPKAENDAERGR
jgi:transposase